MLSERDKEYIRVNCRDKTAYEIAKDIGGYRETVAAFIKRENLAAKASRVNNIKIDFACSPPESCFNCPFKDCIRDVAKAKPSQKEVDFRFIGTIDSVGQGNGRRRV